VKKFLMLAATVAAFGVAGQSRAATYSAVDDFSVASNPNGVWSYLDATPAPTTLSLSSTACGITGAACWWDGQGVPTSVLIAKNTTAGNLSYADVVQSPGVLAIDPESDTAILQFTAPTAGTYTIEGDFTGIATDENSHPVAILDNGVSIYSGTIASYTQDDAFSLSETLAVGGTIDFEVLTGSAGCAYCSLTTGLDATLTVNSAPEPASLFLIGSGLFGLGLIRRRRRG
jgi:hypothetical protein